MTPEMQHIFDHADAEFWLRINDYIEEEFFKLVKIYLEGADKGEQEFIARQYDNYRPF